MRSLERTVAENSLFLNMPVLQSRCIVRHRQSACGEWGLQSLRILLDGYSMETCPHDSFGWQPKTEAGAPAVVLRGDVTEQHEDPMLGNSLSNWSAGGTQSVSGPLGAICKWGVFASGERLHPILNAQPMRASG